YGPTLDLVLDADLRSLAIVDPQLSGRVTAHGRVQGTLSRPSIIGEATLATLRYQDVFVGGAEAQIDLDLGDARSSGPAGAPRSTSFRSKLHRPATSSTVSPGSRPGSRRAVLSRSTGAAGTASSRRRSSASRMAAQTCCSRRPSIFRPRQRAPRQCVSR